MEICGVFACAIVTRIMERVIYLDITGAVSRIPDNNDPVELSGVQRAVPCEARQNGR